MIEMQSGKRIQPRSILEGSKRKEDKSPRCGIKGRSILLRATVLSRFRTEDF